MMWHGRPYACGSWLPEDKKDYMWYGKGQDFSKIGITNFRLRLDVDNICGPSAVNRTR